MAFAALNLPQIALDSVYRAMETIVRNNATFQRIVKPSSFRTWTGKPDDAKPFAFEIAPAMRWTPQPGPAQFVTPSMMRRALMIQCEILLPGTNISDLTNFWGMIETCFYPGPTPTQGPTSNAIVQSLVAVGAIDGLTFFTQAAFDPQPDGVWMAGQAQIKIDVRNDLFT